MTSKKLFRNNFIFALVILIAASLAFPVKGYAATIPTPDVARIGSISVTMIDSKSKELVSGGEFTMYKVAEAKSVGLDWSFEYTDDFAGCSFDLGADLDEKLSDDIATYIKAKSIGGKAASIGDTGKVTFDKLSIGLYLLVQTEAANGYSAVKPFLVSIPLKSGAELIYDVDATPKMGDIAMPTGNPTPTVEPSPGTKPSPSVEPSPSTQPSPSSVPNPSNQPDPTNATKPNDSSVSKSEPSVTKVPAPTVATVAKLPQTGQMNWPIPVMLAAGLACLCIGWYLCNSDTEKEDRDARRSIGKIFMALGVICILGAFGLLGFNSYMNNTAGAMSDKYAVAVKEYIEEHQPSVRASDYLEVEVEEDDVTMTAVEIDGYYYIGYLSIPAQNMYLPIMEEWDNQRLNIAPCRYSGSSKSDDLVIAGHNYKRHFGPLKKLKNDDEVIFTDMEGNNIIYQVVEVEVVEPTDIHEMVTGDWDLTLFTCTYGGQARYALRCTRKILTNTD